MVDDVAAEAERARQAVRGLAHAMNQLREPRAGYDVLGSVTQVLTSMESVLRHLGRLYATTAHQQAAIDGNPAAGIAAAESIAAALQRSRRPPAAPDHEHGPHL